MTDTTVPMDPDAEQTRDDLYGERAHLIALLTIRYPAVITLASDVDEPGWQIVYLSVNGRQASWHIAPRDAHLFAHLDHVGTDDIRAQWDGHTTAEKYHRIRRAISQNAQRWA